MTIYTIENTAGIGKPCKMFDANGVELLYVIEADTETGHIKRRIKDRRGNFILAPSGEESLVVLEAHPPPLRVEWINQERIGFK